jgi:chemosensory pili system protein ChpA (sensor histidine kinase/response regulator)
VIAPQLGRGAVVVLVVEDDSHVRELFRDALKLEGYSVVAVEDGIDALRYLDTHTPSAVVLDLDLPRLHGSDVLSEMAAQGLTKQVPVIVVTGELTEGLNEENFACVLRKPISPYELINAVRRCLNKPHRAEA